MTNMDRSFKKNYISAFPLPAQSCSETQNIQRPNEKNIRQDINQGIRTKYVTGI